MSSRPLPEASIETLPNGLRVAVVPLPHLGAVTVTAVVRVGARYESARTNGLSHLLEHMLFRGTAGHPTSYAFNLAFESLGGTLEATTHTDFTSYRVTLPPAALEAALAPLSEIFESPRFLGFDVEKNVVREELSEGLDEDGADVDPDDLVHEAVFGAHPLGQKLVGTEANLDRFTVEDLRAWHRAHHGARNVVLAIAGPVDPARAHGLARRAFGRLLPGERVVPAPFAAARPGPRVRYVDSPGSQTDLRIGVPTFGERDPRRRALTLLSRVLDDGMSARLFRTIVEDRGLAYDAFGALESLEDVGLWALGAACRHERVVEVAGALLELLAELRRGPIADDELARARTRFLFELDSALDDSAWVAEHAATDLALDVGAPLAVLRAEAERVTLDDLSSVAGAVLRPEHLQLVAVGTLSKAEERALEATVARALR